MRLIKWKLYNLKEKFDHLTHVNVHVNVEGSGPEHYQIMLLLGIPGNDIVLKEKSPDILGLIGNLTRDAHRYLRKSKNRYSR